MAFGLLLALVVVVTDLKGVTGKILSPDSDDAVLEQITLNIWAERHRSVHTLFFALNSNINRDYNSLPSKVTITPAEIEGKVKCAVSLKLRLIKDYKNHRFVCLYKDDFENDKDLFEPSLKIDVEGVRMTMEDIHKNVNPVYGFIPGEPNSVVKGYLLSNKFYGTVRLYDKFRLYHLIFYIEPISNAALYNPKYSDKSLLALEPDENALVFEYVSNTADAEWLNLANYLPPGVFYSSEGQEITDSSSTPTTPITMENTAKTLVSTATTPKTTLTMATTTALTTTKHSTGPKTSTHTTATAKTTTSDQTTNPKTTRKTTNYQTTATKLSAYTTTPKTSATTRKPTTVVTTPKNTTPKETTPKITTPKVTTPRITTVAATSKITTPKVTTQITTPKITTVTTTPKITTVTTAQKTTTLATTPKTTSITTTLKTTTVPTTRITTISTTPETTTPLTTNSYFPHSTDPDQTVTTKATTRLYGHSTLQDSTSGSTSTSPEHSTEPSAIRLAPLHSTVIPDFVSPAHYTSPPPVPPYHSTEGQRATTATYGFYHSTEKTPKVPGVGTHYTEASRQTPRTPSKTTLVTTTTTMNTTTAAKTTTPFFGTDHSTQVTRTTFTTLRSVTALGHLTEFWRNTTVTTTEPSTANHTTPFHSTNFLNNTSSVNPEMSTEVTEAFPSPVHYTLLLTMSKVPQNTTWAKNTTWPKSSSASTQSPTNSTRNTTVAIITSTITTPVANTTILTTTRSTTRTTTPGTTQSPTTERMSTEVNDTTRGFFHSTEKSFKDSSQEIEIRGQISTKTFPTIMARSIGLQALQAFILDENGTHLNSELFQTAGALSLDEGQLVNMAISVYFKNGTLLQNGVIIRVDSKRPFGRGLGIIIEFREKVTTAASTSTTRNTTIITTTHSTTSQMPPKHSTEYNYYHSTDLTKTVTNLNTTVTAANTTVTTSKLATTITSTKQSSANTSALSLIHSTEATTEPVHYTDVTRSPLTSTITKDTTIITTKLNSTTAQLTTNATTSRPSTSQNTTVTVTVTPTTSVNSTLSTKNRSSSTKISTTSTTPQHSTEQLVHSTDVTRTYSPSTTEHPTTAANTSVKTTSITSTTVRTTSTTSIIITNSTTTIRPTTTINTTSLPTTKTTTITPTVTPTIWNKTTTFTTNNMSTNSTILTTIAPFFHSTQPDVSPIHSTDITLYKNVTTGTDRSNTTMVTLTTLASKLNSTTMQNLNSTSTKMGQNLTTTKVATPHEPVHSTQPELPPFHSTEATTIRHTISEHVEITIFDPNNANGNSTFQTDLLDQNSTHIVVDASNISDTTDLLKLIGTNVTISDPNSGTNNGTINGVIIGVNGTQLIIDISGVPPPPEVIGFTIPGSNGTQLFNGTILDQNATTLVIQANDPDGRLNDSLIGTQVEAMFDGVLVNGTIVGINGTNLIIDTSSGLSPTEIIGFTTPGDNSTQLFNGTIVDQNATTLVIQANDPDGRLNDSLIGTQVETMLNGVLVNGTIVGINGTNLIIDVSSDHPPKEIIGFTVPGDNSTQLFNGTIVDQNSTTLVIQATDPNQNLNGSIIGTKIEAMVDGVLVNGTIVDVNGTEITISIEEPSKVPLEHVTVTDPNGNTVLNGTAEMLNDTVIVVHTDPNNTSEIPAVGTNVIVERPDGSKFNGTVTAVNGTDITITELIPIPNIVDQDPAIGDNVTLTINPNPGVTPPELMNATVADRNDTTIVLEVDPSEVTDLTKLINQTLEITTPDGKNITVTVIDANATNIVVQETENVTTAATTPPTIEENPAIGDNVTITINTNPGVTPPELMNATVADRNDTTIVLEIDPSADTDPTKLINQTLEITTPDGKNITVTVIDANATNIVVQETETVNATTTPSPVDEHPAKGDNVTITIDTNPGVTPPELISATVSDRNDTTIVLNVDPSTPMDPTKLVNKTLNITTPDGQNITVTVIDANATSLVVQEAKNVTTPKITTATTEMETDSTTPYHSSDPYETTLVMPPGMHSTDAYTDNESITFKLFEPSTEIIEPFHSTDIPFTFKIETFNPSTEVVTENLLKTTLPRLLTSTTLLHLTTSPTTIDPIVLATMLGRVSKSSELADDYLTTTTTTATNTTIPTTARPSTKVAKTSVTFHPSTEVTTDKNAPLSTDPITKGTNATTVFSKIKLNTTTALQFRGSTEVKDPNATTSTPTKLITFLPTNFILSTEVFTKIERRTTSTTFIPKVLTPTPTEIKMTTKRLRKSTAKRKLVHSTEPNTPPPHSTEGPYNDQKIAAIKSTKLKIKIKTTAKILSTARRTPVHSTEPNSPPPHSTESPNNDNNVNLQRKRRRRDALFNFNNFFGEHAKETSVENDLSNNLKLTGGKTSSDIFDMRSSHSSTCSLCVWIQPHFAEVFGLGGGLLHGISEIIDIIKLTNWIFRAIDFNQDGLSENIGFKISKILLTDSVDFEATPESSIAKENRKRRSAGSAVFRAGKLFGSFLRNPQDLEDAEEAVTRRKREDYFDEVYQNLGSYEDKKLGKNRQLSFSNVQGKQLENLLNDFKRTPTILTPSGALSAASQQLNDKLGDCCAKLGFMYHDLTPTIAATSKRGLCTESSNLGLISGYLHKHKINKLDVFRAVMHSLGHLFGASHVSNTNPDCNDDQLNEFLNPFTMHPIQAVNVGLRPNSMRFSNCAKDQITMFLSSNGPRCLTDDKEEFCGNGEIDKGEACDCGSPWQCHLTYPCCGERDSPMGCKILKTHKKSCHRPTRW